MSEILVVDDEPSIRYLLRAAFESAGHHVVEAKHGRDALDLIESGRVPDLVTTDFMMPVMNGAELIQRIRNDPATAGVPLILVSSSAGAERRATSVDAFFRKPFDPSELAARAAELLGVS
jgi:CheY-like chemotaxis protein